MTRFSARSADVKTLPLAVAAALLTLATSYPAQAQHPEAANAPKFGIAVVDISYVFKEHKRFIATMEGMKNDMKGIEDQLKSKRDAIAQMEEARNRLEVGSADFKKLDDQLATEKAKFNLEMDRQRKNLMEKESQVYFSTYQEVSYAITNYAKQRNIGLVLRFNGDKPDPNKRPDILKDINKPVVFENNIDITRDILAIVNGGAATNVGGRPAAGQPQRQ